LYSRSTLDPSLSKARSTFVAEAARLLNPSESDAVGAIRNVRVRNLAADRALSGRVRSIGVKHSPPIVRHAKAMKKSEKTERM
jgi:hypothetical protein